jgi:tRNA pseudouridine38-40 synthase
MPRLAIGLEYDGTRFCGWQRQNQGRSVQAAVAEAFSRVADESVTVTAAGRTDAGVHALGQVAHFDTLAQRASRSWVLGSNSNLPPDVSVHWVQEVAATFDARYSAIARTYHYLILNREVRSALRRDRGWWVHGELDLGAMQNAAKLVLGEHDFSAFRAAQCQSRSPVRELQRLDIWRTGPFIVIACRANAFLHHMVRNIVGSLVHIGRGDAQAEWLRTVLDGRDRRAAAMTAPACGLYLTQVHYPAGWVMPDPERFAASDL